MSLFKKIQHFLNNERAWAIFLTSVYFSFIIFTCYMKGYNPLDLKFNEIGTFWGGIFTPPVLLFIIAQYALQYDQNKKNNLEIEKKEEEKIRLSQPFFDFTRCHLENIEDVSENDNFDILTFSFLNHRADATNVYIKIISENIYIKDVTEGTSKSFRGKEETIKLYFDDFALGEFEILVTFYDSLALFRSKKFYCTTDYDSYERDDDKIHGQIIQSWTINVTEAKDDN
ncbi:hypothetical protein [Marinomonas sp.]|uniref:hypothetical protein n=1 Tax=Marinomonas sp. TaxID=1904862 RepID=UPI003A8DD97D